MRRFQQRAERRNSVLLICDHVQEHRKSSPQMGPASSPKAHPENNSGLADLKESP